MFGAKKRRQELEKRAAQRARDLQNNAEGKAATERLIARAKAAQRTKTGVIYPKQTYPARATDTFARLVQEHKTYYELEINGAKYKATNPQDIDIIMKTLYPNYGTDRNRGYTQGQKNNFGRLMDAIDPGYKYYDREGKIISAKEHFVDMGYRDNQVDCAEFEDYSISAVFLQGIAHGYDEDNRPFIYELGIFAKDLEGERTEMIHCERFTTEEDIQDRFNEIFEAMDRYGLYTV